MGKILTNEYPETESLTEEQIHLALSGNFDGFKYFFENCMVLQDRDTRQFVHPVMNKGQEMIARTILSYVDRETRATTHKECVIIGPRQFGKSTLLTAISNYIEAWRILTWSRPCSKHLLRLSFSARRWRRFFPMSIR